MRIIATTLCLFGLCFMLLSSTFGGELLDSVKLEKPAMTYDVLLPDDYADGKKTYPLILFLHGGGEGNHVILRRFQEAIEELWDRKQLPPMVFVTPHAGPLSFYLDFKDDSKSWESWITGPFLAEVRRKFRVSKKPEHTLMAGVSMGGAGALKFGLKRPGQFRAIAAVEPAIQPALYWQDVNKENCFWFTDELWEQRYGSPVSADYWAENNPAWLVVVHAEKIRKSGLKIYLECADEDYLELHRGAEFLHRTMWDAGIKHEYHVFNGADHVGSTLGPRIQEALRFLGKTLEEAEPEEEVIEFRKSTDYWREHREPMPKDN